ncbi:MAG TPA: glycosyltransferase [Phycisphaerae bacterium]|nr:glycosyltransferase [Phycisphaerae bacterium]
MSSVSDLRQQIERLLQSADPYPFLAVVEDYLAAVPVDDAIRARAVSLLAGKGLLSVGAEVARGCPPASANAADLHRAAQQLGAVQTDMIEPRTTEKRFHANLEALRGRGGEFGGLADEVERAWRDGRGEITLHRVSDGNLLARAVRSDGRRIWLPEALDFANRIEVLSANPKWQGVLVPPFLIEGVGAGWFIPRLHAATRCTYLTYSPAIYVVEPNLRALAAVLNLHDWSGVLSDERVYVFGGPQGWENWKDLVVREASLSLPLSVINLATWPGAPAAVGELFLEEARNRREAEFNGIRRRVDGHYDKLDRAHWARRYATAGAADPLRVLLVTSRFTTFLRHSARDLAAAFERAGLGARLLIEPHDHALLDRRHVMEMFEGFRPDLVLVIDHHRAEPPERYPRNVPFVCWIQDDLPPLFEPDVGARMHELDFTMGYGRTRCVLQCGYPADRFMPSRLAVDIGKFAPAADERPDPSLRCDVVFVSNHSESPETLRDRLLEHNQDEVLQRLMEAFFEETRPLMRSPRFNAGYSAETLLSDVEAKVGLHCPDGPFRDRLMGMYVRPLVDRTIRHATLEWIADWADGAGRVLHLYGRDWERHPRFGRYARGVAEHGGHLARIARNAAINLHCGSSPSLHQRVLETLAAAGFPMARFHPLDFGPPGHESFRRYLLDRDIRGPRRVPIDELPSDYIEGRRRRDALMGRATPAFIEITREYLFEQNPRSGDDRRYELAELAFPGFERITFDSPGLFARRAGHFIAHPEERADIVRSMQASVRELFTYDALVNRLLAFLREGLSRAG